MKGAAKPMLQPTTREEVWKSRKRRAADLRQPTTREHLLAILDASTDGCSVAPDLNIRECCEDHDFHYRNGCTKGGFRLTRAQADRLLRLCIAAQGVGFYRYRLLPWLYWLAVRLVGWRHWQGVNNG